MRPKKVELILVFLLVISGVFAKYHIHVFFFISLLLLGTILSFYYLLFYNNNLNEKNILLNLFARWILALFPVTFSIMFINADIARIIELSYFVFGFILVLLKSKNNVIDKYEIIRMYLFLVILSIAGQAN